MSTLSNNYGYGHSGKYTNPALDDAGNLYLAMCEGTSEKGYIACYVTEEFDDTAPVQATWSYDRSTRHRRRLRPGSRRRSICIDGEHLHVARRADRTLGLGSSGRGQRRKHPLLRQGGLLYGALLRRRGASTGRRSPMPWRPRRSSRITASSTCSGSPEATAACMPSTSASQARPTPRGAARTKCTSQFRTALTANNRRIMKRLFFSYMHRRGAASFRRLQRRSDLRRRGGTDLDRHFVHLRRKAPATDCGPSRRSTSRTPRKLQAAVPPPSNGISDSRVSAAPPREENPTVVFTSAGEKTVTLTVTAADGTKVSGSQKITLQRTNGLPEASFTHDPEAPSIGTRSPSPTPRSTATERSSPGPGISVTATGRNIKAPYTPYTASGSYTVTLTVTDNDGGEDTATPESRGQRSSRSGTGLEYAHCRSRADQPRSRRTGQQPPLRRNHGGRNGRRQPHDAPDRLALRPRPKDGAALGDPMNTPSVDSDGTVYYAVGNRAPPSSTPSTGRRKPKWKYTIGSSGVRVDYNYPLISDQDYIVIGNRGTNGSIIVLSKSDGSERFRGRPPAAWEDVWPWHKTGPSCPAPREPNAFTLSRLPERLLDDLQHPLNASGTGTMPTAYNPPSTVRGVSILPSGTNRRAAARSAVSTCRSLTAAQLQPEWQVDCDAPKYSGCVLGPDSRVYVVSQQDGGIGRPRRSPSWDGTLLWSWPHESKDPLRPGRRQCQEHPSRIRGRKLHHHLSRREILFKEQCCAKSHTSPVIGDDGMVYLLGEQTKGGPATSMLLQTEIRNRARRYRLAAIRTECPAYGTSTAVKPKRGTMQKTRGWEIDPSPFHISPRKHPQRRGTPPPKPHTSARHRSDSLPCEGFLLPFFIEKR